MNPAENQKLVEYIKTSLQNGVAKEELYKTLLANGWTIDTIQKSINDIENPIAPEDTQKKTIQVILIIAITLIGVGIFSFIAANWEGMNDITKIAVIIVAMITAYAAGWYAKEQSHLAKTSEVLFCLGTIIYGAGIFLIGQIFHVQANWPDGFILWMMGSLAMAFALGSYPLFYLAAVCGAVALSGFSFGMISGWGYNQFLLSSSTLVVIAMLVTFLTGWIIRKKMPPQFKEYY